MRQVALDVPLRVFLSAVVFVEFWSKI